MFEWRVHAHYCDGREGKRQRATSETLVGHWVTTSEPPRGVSRGWVMMGSDMSGQLFGKKDR